MKDQEIAGLRKKEQTFRSTVDNIQLKVDTELIRNRDLDEQVRTRGNSSINQPFH